MHPQETSIEEHTQSHHIVGLKTYGIVLAILFVLTAVTVVVSFIPLGAWNVPVAMLIATAKASLVALIFMHVRWSGKLVAMSLITSIIFLLVLLFGLMMDPLTRKDVDEAQAVPRMYGR